MTDQRQNLRKKPPAFKIPVASTTSHYRYHNNNIQPVVLIANDVESLTDHTEVQVNGVKITVAIKDMEVIDKLGEGHYGVVEKMLHRPSNLIFAVKQIRCSMNGQKENRILNDLNISMRSTKCPYVVVSYGAMFQGGDVWICMELLDISLDKFYKKVQEISSSAFIPERLLAYITFCVVTALEYLHLELKVIHRDVKPSNMLIDKCGRVKVCDFGISGNLVNSLAITNVGSQPYLAPERISTNENVSGYTIRSDVWSLGLSVLELASCKFPYSHRSSIYDQIVNVVERQPPSLPENSIYSNVVRDFISRCLVKDGRCRATYVELLQHEMLLPFKSESYLQESVNGFANYVIQILGQ